MKNKKYWLKRGALGGLCLALAAALLFSPLTGGRQVSAVSSLPYIEKIKSTKASFNILEITPNVADSGALAGNGTFGYYAAGSEPCSGWQTRLAAITTPEARDEAAETLFKGLATAGILGSGDDTPLKTTAYTAADGYYQEAYPWMLQSTAGWAALPLAAAESADVTGTFAQRTTNSAGPFFREVYSTEIAAQTNGAYTGDLDQVVDLVTWFSENPASSSDYWYYAPSAWTKLEWKDGTISMSDYGLTGSSYVYTFVDDTPLISTDQVGHYVSAGQISAILLDKTETYYILDPAKLGVPHQAWSKDSPYGVSRSTAYTANAAKTGYFQSSSGTAYSLTTDNSGDYVFTASDTGSPFRIYYDQVYFKCTAGADNVYTNNQWFLKKVFDISNPGSGSIAVRVNTYAANNASLATLVRSADLIVLSTGLMPGTGETPAANIDLTDEARKALQQAVVTDKTPLVFDWRLTSAAFYSSSAIVNLPALVSGLAGSAAGADHNFATGNLYCFNPSTTLISGQNVKGIATPLFGTAFTATATAAGFSGALSEIESENFLRERAGLDAAALLDAHVSMAAAVRYIINQREARTLKALTSVRVLELEPATAVQQIANTSANAKAKVFEWLGSPASLADYATRADAITITSMAMSEFEGRIENLVETYDLIYIGDSTIGLQTDSTTGETTYNDATNMNGLLYTNIGDTYKASYQLTGLLDRDYSSSSSDGHREIDASSSTKATTFRFSGNDLTESKAQELREFAEGGYPIILGDKLMSYSTKNKTINFSVAVTGSGEGSNATLTASIPEDLPEGQRITYQWHYVSSWNGYDYPYGSAATTTSASNAITVSSDYAGDQFYCVATIGGGSATSNRVLISKTASNLTVNEGYAAKQDVTVKGGGGSTTYTAVTTTNKTGWQLGKATVTMTADLSPALSDGITIKSYNWKYKNGSGGNWRDYTGSGSSGSSISVTPTTDSYDYYFSCSLTLSNGTTLRTNSVWLYYDYDDYKNWTWISTSGTGEQTTISSASSYVLSVDAYAGTPSGDSVELTSRITPAGASVSYQWQRSSSSNDFSRINNATASSYSLTQSEEGTYYYRLRIRIKVGDTNYNAYSNVIQVTRSGGTLSVSPVSGYPGSSGSFVGTEIDTTTLSLNTQRLDRASNLYAALSAVVGKPNVMPKLKVTPGKTDYAVNSGTLYQYLNLSKPKLDWVATTDENCRDGYPTAYALTDTGTITSLAPLADGSYSLTYSFQITNATDPTPQTTTYDCRFFIDLNADGLYKSDERLGGVEITLADTGKIVQPSGGVYALKPGTVYKLTRPLPEDKVGLIAWKLEVAQNGDNAYSHASQHGYTHIAATTKTPIRILQILHNNGGGLNLNTNETYKEWLPKVPDFDITIETINAANLDDSRYWVVNGARTTRAEYFAQYDMLILGFADMYREISVDAAKDIVAYSKNHAVLFTHDTTSFCNVPYKNLKRTDGYNVYGDYWGYAFNSVLRSAVGLDRYGVTDATWGRTTMYDGTKNNHPVSSGAISLTAKDSTGALISDQIRKAGYTLAYTPKKTAVADLSGYALSTVAETQGYTSHTLLRYKGSNTVTPSTYNDRATTYVSQVNEGQITTYPFNLNSTEFGGAMTTSLKVSETHEQYYQLNMNSDDIVVWYCLSNSASSALTDNGYYASPSNDVINSYYIYTQGNITYSGAGHSGVNVTDDEAKLFINTMVAAFRSVAQQPEVSVIRSADDPTAMPYKYFALDFTNADGTTDTSDFVSAISADKRKVFFRITDPSLSSGSRSTTISYEYVALTAQRAEIADTKKTIAAADAGFSTSYGSGTPYIGQTLWMTVPDEALTLLTDQNTASVRLIIKVHTVNGDRQFDCTASVDLRKIGLFQLN